MYESGDGQAKREFYYHENSNNNIDDSMLHTLHICKVCKVLPRFLSMSPAFILTTVKIIENMRKDKLTCATVTLANFIFSFLAFFNAFFPDFRGTSMVGVLIFALAVINISLRYTKPWLEKQIKFAMKNTAH